MSGMGMKSILKRVSRYEGGTEKEDVVPPRRGEPFDEWQMKLRFCLTPEQFAKSDSWNYGENYAGRKKRRLERRGLSEEDWGMLSAQEKIELRREWAEKRSLEEEDEEESTDWAAKGYVVYASMEEWERMEGKRGKGKEEVEEKKEERVYTGITVTEFNPVVDNFKKKWMGIIELVIKVEGGWGDGGDG